MKVVYFTYVKEGAKKGGFAKSIKDAREKARFILGEKSIKREHNFTSTLLEFKTNKEGMMEMLELSHAYGQLAERDSRRPYYAARR